MASYPRRPAFVQEKSWQFHLVVELLYVYSKNMRGALYTSNNSNGPFPNPSIITIGNHRSTLD